MKYLFSFSVSIFLFTPLFSQIQTNLHKIADKGKMTAWVDSVYSQMTLDERVGQLFIPVVEPKEKWKIKISEYINKQKVGGLLFSKGVLRGQAEITNYAQGIAKIPLLIALDGEWGLSMRLSDAPRFPRNMIIGAIQDEETLKEYGKEVARQCREMGIHVNFAPSLDVHSNPLNPVIGVRSFSENPQKVAIQGIAFAKGMEENGVMSVAKHFPGHGDTSDDSHKTLPTINHGLSRLDSIELFPFKQYIEAGLSGMMIGHLNVPALQTQNMPASLSREIGIGLLKEKMNFSGLVFTDGMAMKGVSNQPDKSVRALLAGNDVILGVTDQKREIDAVKEAVINQRIPQQLLEEKVKKILSYKYMLGVHRTKPIAVAGLAKRIESPQTEWIQSRIYDKAMTLLRNDSSILPVRKLDKNKIVSVAMGVSSEPAFQKWMKRYAPVTNYQVRNKEEIEKLNVRIGNPDILIISVSSVFYNDVWVSELMAKAKKAILVLFDLPKGLDGLTLSTDKAQAVLVAYDNTDFAQKSAAQAIFGGISVSGKLPVSTVRFAENSGLATPKTRLSYSFPEEIGIDSGKLSEIEAIALQGIKQKAYPGCYVLVAKDGNIIYNRAFGNFEYGVSLKVTDSTVYDLASVTKATATLLAIMKLYDEQKIRLQDSFGKFVPETKGTDKAKITLRKALLHESGLTSFIPYYTSAIDSGSYTGPLFGNRSALYHAHYAGAWGRTDFKFIPAFISSSQSDIYYLPVAKNIYAGDAMHDALLKDIIGSKLRNPERYVYSCLNFMLLKEVVENVSETDLNTFLQNNFYKKLGAQTTTFQPLKYMSADLIPPTENDPFFRQQQIKGYVHDEGAALFGGISGNAGLFSNAEDLAKVCQMYLDFGEYGGERLLGEETVKLFTRTKSSISRRGLGFDKPDPRGGKVSPTGSFAPISVYGHTGFTGTCFWIDPDNRLVYIFLSNRTYPSRLPNRLSSLDIRERIQDVIYKAIQ